MRATRRRGDGRLARRVCFDEAIRRGNLPLILGLAWANIAIFALATLCEHDDHAIAEAIVVSGHTVKHLVSALAGWLAVPMVSGRSTRATMTGRPA